MFSVNHLWYKISHQDTNALRQILENIAPVTDAIDIELEDYH